MKLWKAAPASDAVTAGVRFTVIALLFLSLSATAFAHSRKPKPAPRSLLFSTAGSLLAQNAEADRQHLPRIQNKEELAELINDGELAPLVSLPALYIKPKNEHAYLRPWAASEAFCIAQLFYNENHKQLVLTSAVRTVKEQKALGRHNHNAAPPSGPLASVHMTGIAFDIGRSGLTQAQQRWLEWRLFYLQSIGKVIVEEEYREPCFHVVALK
jgi:hypothetical protein